jgi:hypothetical protein
VRPNRPRSALGRHPAWLLGLGSSLWFALSCGTGGPKIPPELLENPGGGTGSSDYPNGPYGTKVGEVVPNLQFIGFENPRLSQSSTNVALSDFYRPADKHAILLLNTAAVWCQPCQVEHQDLPSKVDALGPRGLEVFSLIYQDANGKPANEETVSVWANTFDTNFALAADPDFQLGQFGPADSPPLNVVIDAKTMRILAIFLGNQSDQLWAYIERELAVP